MYVSNEGVHLIESLYKKMPEPKFNVEMRSHFKQSLVGPTEASELVKRGMYSLEEMSFSHEQKLLCEAGPFQSSQTSGQLPPCMFKENCVGKSIKMNYIATPNMPRHDGSTLVQLMTPSELETLLGTGKPPREERPCVLCYRKAFTNSVYQNLSLGIPVTDYRDKCIQYYRNPIDVPDGYNKKFAIGPTDPKMIACGVFDYICKLNALSLCWEFRVLHGKLRWVVDQSNLQWKEDETAAQKRTTTVRRPALLEAPRRQYFR